MSALAAAGALALALVFAQSQFDGVTIRTTELADGVYMLEGAGGNMAVSVGPDGVILIDDQFAPLSERIQAAIGELSDLQVRFVLNTHWHGDHTGGNEAFGATGAVIVAHDNVRERMSVDQFNDLLGRETKAADPAALPVVTFTDQVTFHLNGRPVEVVHVPAAHTDGDSIVRFVGSNVVHAGDVFFSGRFPLIDVDSGGSIDGMIEALEMIVAMSGPETKIIAGHGPLGSAADVLSSIDMLKTVRARVQARIDAGDTEDEAVAAAPLKDLEAEWAWRFISGDRMVRSVYRSLTG